MSVSAHRLEIRFARLHSVYISQLIMSKHMFSISEVYIALATQQAIQQLFNTVH